MALKKLPRVPFLNGHITIMALENQLKTTGLRKHMIATLHLKRINGFALETEIEIDIFALRKIKNLSNNHAH
jgi:hypothetical protein